MPKNCFICKQCYSKKKGDTDRKLISLFKVPAKKLDEWKGIVNKSGLSLTSHLCSSHFEPRYFKIYIKSGQNVCRLTSDAKPTLLLQSTHSKSPHFVKPSTNHISTMQATSKR